MTVVSSLLPWGKWAEKVGMEPLSAEDRGPRTGVQGAGGRMQDSAMPPSACSFAHVWKLWNGPDLSTVGGMVEGALTPSFPYCPCASYGDIALAPITLWKQWKQFLLKA